MKAAWRESWRWCEREPGRGQSVAATVCRPFETAARSHMMSASDIYLTGQSIWGNAANMSSAHLAKAWYPKQPSSTPRLHLPNHKGAGEAVSQAEAQPRTGRGMEALSWTAAAPLSNSEVGAKGSRKQEGWGCWSCRESKQELFRNEWPWRKACSCMWHGYGRQRPVQNTIRSTGQSGRRASLRVSLRRGGRLVVTCLHASRCDRCIRQY